MADDWKLELKKAMILFLVAEGFLVRGNDRQPGLSYGGWQDFSSSKGDRYLTTELSEHVVKCGLKLGKCSYVESDWDEFAGTFAEPSWENRKGTDAVIFCTCGRVKGRSWRYTGSVAEMITAITK